MEFLVFYSYIALAFMGLGWVGWYFFCRPNAQKMGMSSQECVVSPLPPVQHDVRHAAQKIELTVWLMTRWKVWGLPLLMVFIVAVIIALTMAFAEKRTLEPLDIQEFSAQDHIRLALSKENLVPPAPLPPTLFLNTERPGLANADRDWSRLDPFFMKRVLLLFGQMEKRGYQMALLEGYRSPERQERLAAMGSAVTQAKANQSKHQFGMAVDIAPVKEGKLVISERDPWAAEAYKALGEESEALGMTWGGRWSFRDYGHIELTGSLAELIRAQMERSKS